MEATHFSSKSGDETGYDSSCSSCISTTLVGDPRRSCISDISFGSSRSVSANSYAASTISTSSSSRYSSSTSVAHKPHKANQAEWETIRSCTGSIGLDHFRLVRRLGSGDLGNVYLCRLREPRLSGCLYAMKVVDKEALAIRKKLERAETEKEILSMLDHPFLPTLYADFEEAHYSCIVMEFCPGGDLHAVRQRQPRRRFSLSAVRFYATEILLALEYLHMMGVVYRDLKPENVLVRADGHIMLSDFDLSFKCDVVPKLLRPKRLYNPDNRDPKSTKPSVPSCVPPMQPVLSCLLGSKSYKKKSPPASAKEEIEDDEGNEDKETREMDPELVAEPISARSQSFVGTHEYLAPEVISGLGHGSAVDWWTLGVFLYELLYGKTPFKGENNEKTLVNIVKHPLRFPPTMSAVNSSTKEMEEMSKVQDLILKLLAKNPKKRIGSQMGSVEIKRHDFFKGTNWALVRSVRPPEVPVDLQKILHANKSTTLVRHKQHLGRNVGRETKACANIHNSYHIPHHFEYF